jgi:(p)ppGpp synthase/HD superfamily hydrolase
VHTNLELARGLLEAIEFAAHKHRFQRRKDPGEPAYINHPIRVARLLAEVGRVSSLATLQAAILHDTLEDTDTTFEELEEKFGSKAAGIVREVTDDKSLRKGERKRLQIERAPHLSRPAKQIKIGDKIANIMDVTYSPPKGWSKERRREYLTWSRRVVAGCRGANKELEAHYDRLLRRCRRSLQKQCA